MRIHLLCGAAGLCVVLSVSALTRPAGTAPALPAAGAPGHLILQVEGDVRGLRVTAITPKPSGYNPTRVESDFAVELLDATGAGLGTYPLDLSRFDRNPANVGRQVRVEGCEVIDTRIATLVNVPWSPQLASLRIRHGDRTIGSLGAAELTGLVKQGEVR